MNLRIEPDKNKFSSLRFIVEDSGISISEADKDKLFKPFSQIPGQHQVQGGTGLGLCLSRQLATLLRGTLEMESSLPNNGSKFCLTIPIELGRAPKQPLHREIVVDSGKSLPLNGLSILVVEDMDDNWLLMKHTLQQLGANSDRAEDGLIGVQMALSGSYHVILMDLAMPRMSGFEATQALRSRGYSGVIIAVSATVTPTCKAESVSAGCDDHVAKPIKSKTLCDVIMHHVQTYTQLP